MSKKPRQIIPVAPRTYEKLVKEYAESDYAKIEVKNKQLREQIKACKLENEALDRVVKAQIDVAACFAGEIKRFAAAAFIIGAAIGALIGLFL